MKHSQKVLENNTTHVTKKRNTIAFTTKKLKHTGHFELLIAVKKG
jgi:hypothetical protein